MSSVPPRSTFRLPPRRKPARSAVRLHAPSDQIRAAADPWCGGWMRLLTETVGQAALESGLELVEAGFVAELGTQPGRVTAAVLRDEPTGRENVSIEFDLIPIDAWHVVASTASAGAAGSAIAKYRDWGPLRPAATATEVGGPLPDDLPERLVGTGHSVWPHELRVQCSCSGADGRGPQSRCIGIGVPCPHAAAAGWIVGDRLLADPWQALSLRGIEPAEFVAAVRQARVVRARGRAAAHPEVPLTDTQAPPLESRIDDFWQCDPCIHELEQLPATNHAPHALLRRLGPPPLNGRFPLLGLLASVYDTVSQSTARSRDIREQSDT